MSSVSKTVGGYVSRVVSDKRQGVKACLTESRAGGDGAHSPLAVAELGGDDESPLLANAHFEETLLPALDHLAGANGDLERPAAVVGSVELLVGGLQLSAVVDADAVALDRLALALDGGGDVDLELLGGDEADGAGGQEAEVEECALHCGCGLSDLN